MRLVYTQMGGLGMGGGGGMGGGFTRSGTANRRVVPTEKMQEYILLLSLSVGSSIPIYL